MLLLYLFCNAHKGTITISGEYWYVVPENVSLEEAKATAIEKAKIEAMATAFKTVVSQTNTSTLKNENGKSQKSFHSYGGTETKGEWLGNTHDPEVNVIYENNMMVVTVKVWSRTREIKSDID